MLVSDDGQWMIASGEERWRDASNKRVELPHGTRFALIDILGDDDPVHHVQTEDGRVLFRIISEERRTRKRKKKAPKPPRKKTHLRVVEGLEAELDLALPDPDPQPEPPTVETEPPPAPVKADPPPVASRTPPAPREPTPVEAPPTRPVPVAPSVQRARPAAPRPRIRPDAPLIDPPGPEVDLEPVLWLNPVIVRGAVAFCVVYTLLSAVVLLVLAFNAIGD